MHGFAKGFARGTHVDSWRLRRFSDEVVEGFSCVGRGSAGGAVLVQARLWALRYRGTTVILYSSWCGAVFGGLMPGVHRSWKGVEGGRGRKGGGGGSLRVILGSDAGLSVIPRVGINCIFFWEAKTFLAD